MVFLQEDHHAVGQGDALRFGRVKRWERRDGNLLPAGLRVNGYGTDGDDRQKSEGGEEIRKQVLHSGESCHFAPPAVGACSFYGFVDAHGAIALRKSLVSYSANVGLGDLVDPVDGLEQLAPVAVARLVDGELLREALIVAEAADQVGFRARLDHLQFVVGDVFFLDAVNLGVNGVA